MKKLVTHLKVLCLTLAMVLGIVGFAGAQVTVEPGEDLFEVISSYLDDDGMLSESVFMLKRKGVYFMSETIYTNDDLILKGEEGDDDVRPAMIIPRAAPDGNYVNTWFYIEGIGKKFVATDIIFQMLTLQAMETGININTLITATSDDQKVIFDRCIINGAGNNVIGSGGDGQYIKITNCRLRNNRNLSDDWSGGFLYGNWSAGGWRDSLIFRNNTLVNIGNGGLRCFTGETSRAVIIDHNTFFGTTRPNLYIRSQSNIVGTNNMFVASNASGTPKSRGNGGDPITLYDSTFYGDTTIGASVFTCNLLDAAAYPYLETLFGFDVSGDQESIEMQRRFVIKNNCCFWPRELVLAWDTCDEDGGRQKPEIRMGDFTEWQFDHQPNTVIENMFGHEGSEDALTSDFDPGFDPAVVSRVMTPMNTWIDGFRNEEGWIPFMCNIDDPGKEIQLQWPLPENFAYTNEELIKGGTDGLPIGDLNWFKGSLGIGDHTAAGSDIEIRNYPNPFTGYTTLSYNLKESSDVKVTIYNVVGKEIAVLVNDRQQPGNHTVRWEPGKISNTPPTKGIYICKIQVGMNTGYTKLIYNGN